MAPLLAAVLNVSTLLLPTAPSPPTPSPVKLATPLTATAVVVPMRVPVPVLRETATVRDESLPEVTTAEPSVYWIWTTGCVGNGVLAVLVDDGCCDTESLT